MSVLTFAGGGAGWEGVCRLSGVRLRPPPAFLAPAQARPARAFPEPEAAVLGRGSVPPALVPAGAFRVVPHPMLGPEADAGSRGPLRPAQGPSAERDTVPFPHPRPSRSKASPHSAPSSGSQTLPVYSRRSPRLSRDWLSPLPPQASRPALGHKSHLTPAVRAVCPRKPPARLPSRVETLVPNCAWDRGHGQPVFVKRTDGTGRPSMGDGSGGGVGGCRVMEWRPEERDVSAW